MEGGTVFHFVDASPAEALDLAREAAGDLDVRIGGGPALLREFLAAGLIDVARVVQVPILLGRGVRLWDGLDALDGRYAIEAVPPRAGSRTWPSPGGDVTAWTRGRSARDAGPWRAPGHRRARGGSRRAVLPRIRTGRTGREHHGFARAAHDRSRNDERPRRDAASPRAGAARAAADRNDAHHQRERAALPAVESHRREGAARCAAA